MPPSKSELEEWSIRKMAVIGSPVKEGVGDAFTACQPGNELRNPISVPTSSIIKNCYPSNLFRSACFTSWEAHFEIISLPIFLDTARNESAYIITPSGTKLSAEVGAYCTSDVHALLITAVPKTLTNTVTLNCFVSATGLACIDLLTGQFGHMTMPDNPASATNFRHCNYHYCWDFPAAFFQKMAELQDNARVAHNQADPGLARRRRSISDPPGTIHVWHPSWLSPADPDATWLPANFPRRGTAPPIATPAPPRSPGGLPESFGFNALPTSAATTADVECLEERVQTLYQTNLYNLAVLSHQVNDLRRNQYHILLSLSKLDDQLLAHLWHQSFTTHFVSYDQFSIKPSPVQHASASRSSNCRHNNTEIFLAGRYVAKTTDDQCHTWTEADVTKVDVFAREKLVVPAASAIRHTAAQQEFSWSALLRQRAGLEEGTLLRQFGGVRSTGLADVLNFPPSLIPAYFNTLFPLSGLGTLSFIILGLFCCIYLRH